MNNKGRGEVNNEKIGKLSGHQINEFEFCYKY